MARGAEDLKVIELGAPKFNINLMTDTERKSFMLIFLDGMKREAQRKEEKEAARA